jgi:hypothetical protein
MKRHLFAAMVVMLLGGFVLAEEFTLQISAINDDGSVTGKKFKGGKGGFKAEEVTVKLAKGVTVRKGKFDADSKGFVAEGDDLKLSGLKAAFTQAQNGAVLVSGKALSDSDKLELAMKDGKPSAKLNGKDIPFTDVAVRGKANLATRVTTNDDGAVTAILLTGGGGGFKGKAKTDK